jgi:hypothetical protein
MTKMTQLFLSFTEVTQNSHRADHHDKRFCFNCHPSWLLTWQQQLVLWLPLRCRVLKDSHNAPSEPTGEMRHLAFMSSKQARHRKVLASFVEQLPQQSKGWWCRLPSRVTPSKDDKPLPTDAIAPHLGQVFGLTELATWAMLVEMGCMSENERSKSWGVNAEGWELLMVEFGVDKSIQVSPTKFEENGSRVHFVRLGFPQQDSPREIWPRCKKETIKFPPTTIAGRATLKFVAVELLQVSKGSNVFFEILQSYAGVDVAAPHGVDAALLSTSERNNRAVAQLLVNDDSDDETDTEDKDTDDKSEEEGDADKEEEATTESSEAATLSAAADVTVGEVADQKEFPMMHKLNVSAES